MNQIDDSRRFEFGTLLRLDQSVDDAILSKIFDEFQAVESDSFSDETQKYSLDQSRLTSILTQIQAWKTGRTDNRVPACVTRIEAAAKWGLGEWKAETAAQDLVGGGDDKDPISMQLAVTILARDSHFKQATEILAAIPADTRELTWTTFELNKYYAKYSGELYPENGTPDPDDLARRKEYRDFVKDVYLPKVQKILDSVQDPSYLERLQIVTAIEDMADKVHRHLTPRLYLDLSQETTDTLLPDIIETWERSLDLLDEKDEMQAELKKNLTKKIEAYRKSIIPHLKQLQRDQVYFRELRAIKRDARAERPSVLTAQ